LAIGTSDGKKKTTKMTKMNRSILIKLFLNIMAVLLFTGCGKEKSNSFNLTVEDSTRIINEILTHRSSVDSSFRSDPQSPFIRDTSIRFTGIKWFAPDLKYYFKSILTKYEKPETVQVYGTKGDARNYIKYGYFTFNFEGTVYRINAYKFAVNDARRSLAYENYLSVWFTDITTGKETYHVGRYLEVGEENADHQHLYVLNFNNAYSPYCSYSSLYSCAVPRKEDYLPIPINAGELKYHD
jgi:uncharacterized protein